MDGTKDYRVKITVRNNYLLTAMEDAGIASLAELARKCGRSSAQFYGIAGLKLSGLKSNGQWRDILLDAALVLDCQPGDLVPPQHWEKVMPINSGEIEMGREDVAGLLGPQYSPAEAIPDLRIEKDEALATIHASLDILDERERYCVERVHGLDGDPPVPYRVIAEHLGISRSRAHLLYERSIQKLKRPTITGTGKQLRSAMETLGRTES